MNSAATSDAPPVKPRKQTSPHNFSSKDKPGQ